MKEVIVCPSCGEIVWYDAFPEKCPGCGCKLHDVPIRDIGDWIREREEE